MHVRTTAAELARWLELQGGGWHVEGEPALSKSLPIPTTAMSLVHVLRKRSAELVVLAPDTSSFADDAVIGSKDISSAAHVIDGKRLFQLAWVLADGTVADSWLLVEQQPKPGTSDPGSVRTVVDAFRAALPERARTPR
jgi:hypothetical protein